MSDSAGTMKAPLQAQVLASLLLVALSFLRVTAADVYSIWNGSYGQWNEPTNWLHTPALPGADFPDNDSLTYDVEIATGEAIIQGPPFGPTIENLYLGGRITKIYGAEFPLIVRNQLLWTNGGFAGDGWIVVSNGMTISGPESKQAGLVRFHLHGASSLSGGVFTSGAEWNNYGTFDLDYEGIFPGYFINNHGLLRKNGTTRTHLMGHFESTNALQVNAGTLEFNTVNLSGSVHIETNAELVLHWGNFGLSFSNQVTGGGRLRITGSTLTIGAEALSVGSVEISDQDLTILGNGRTGTNSTISVSNSYLSGPGSLLVTTGAVLTIDNSQASFLKFTNHGLTVFRGTNAYPSPNYGQFVNHHVVELQGDVKWLVFGYDEDYFENLGVFRKTSGTGLATFTGHRFNNRGRVEVNVGKLFWRASGTNVGEFTTASGATTEFFTAQGGPAFLFAEGTTLSGEGTNRIYSGACRFSGNITNRGQFELQVGWLMRDFALPPGIFHNESNATLTVFPGSDSAIQGTLNNHGVVKVSGVGSLKVYGLNLNASSVLDSPLNAAIPVTGHAALGGVLQLRLPNGFQPVLGQEFTLMTYDTVSGFFSRIHGLALPNGLRLEPKLANQQLSFTVVAAPPAGITPMSIQNVGSNLLRIGWPVGYSGFYFQTSTNLAQPWATHSITDTNFLDWSVATNEPQRFFRLFDPDSP